jgi:hypothetical protein
MKGFQDAEAPARSVVVVTSDLAERASSPSSPQKSSTWSRLVVGRACHYVLLFILTCSITAVIVCIFAHVQRRWALNVRLARG